MPASITSKPTSPILTSLLGNIRFSTNEEYLDVVISNPNGVKILDERFYASDGYVTIYNPAPIIEADIRSIKNCFIPYNIAAYKNGSLLDSHTFNLVYCDKFSVCTNTETFLRQNFLTSTQFHRISPNGIIFYYLIALADEYVNFDYIVQWKAPSIDNSIHTYTGVYRTYTSVYSSRWITGNLFLATVRTKISQDNDLRTDKIELLSVTMRAGQRSMTFFIDKSIPDHPFFNFRNAFNCWEPLFVPVNTTAKTEVERSTAILNIDSQFYDQKVSKAYEVETGPLTSDEMESIEEFVASLDVALVQPDPIKNNGTLISQTVLISESHCEFDLNGEKPNTAKFTWRFANNRPLIKMAASIDIFNEPYLIPFS